MHWRGYGKASAGPARRGREYPCPANRRWFITSQLSIINRQSSIINSDGFTLIELLVVISIIALLLAILFPALRAARSHARTAKCQGILHQWGLYYAIYTADNEYKLPAYWQTTFTIPDVLPRNFYKHHYVGKDPSPGPRGDGVYWDLQWYRRLLFCPEASGLPANPEAVPGRTHSVWVVAYLDDRTLSMMSSYGLNGWTPGPPEPGHSIPSQLGKPIWVSCVIKGAASVPTYFDCMLDFACPQETDLPGPMEDAPAEFLPYFGMPTCVMDRHRGGINSLFMDWSVRKVGVKEPWTLKWSPSYNTAGRWTKQGGVKPEDWPEWMRGFKDY